MRLELLGQIWLDELYESKCPLLIFVSSATVGKLVILLPLEGAGVEVLVVLGSLAIPFDPLDEDLLSARPIEPASYDASPVKCANFEELEREKWGLGHATRSECFEKGRPRAKSHSRATLDVRLLFWATIFVRASHLYGAHNADGFAEAHGCVPSTGIGIRY